MAKKLAIAAGIAQGLNQSTDKLMQIMAAKYKIEQDKKQQAEETKFKERQLNLLESKYQNELTKTQSQAELFSKFAQNPDVLPAGSSFTYGGMTIKGTPQETPMSDYQRESLGLRKQEIANKQTMTESQQITAGLKEKEQDMRNVQFAYKLAKSNNPDDPDYKPTLDDVKAALISADKAGTIKLTDAHRESLLKPQMQRQFNNNTTQPPAQNAGQAQMQTTNQPAQTQASIQQYIQDLFAQGLNAEQVREKLIGEGYKVK